MIIGELYNFFLPRKKTCARENLAHPDFRRNPKFCKKLSERILLHLVIMILG